MNPKVFLRITATELRLALLRPAAVMILLVFGLIAWLLSSGHMRFGGMAATGVKLAINSEYAVAIVLGMFSFVLMHFTATLTGGAVVRDIRTGIVPFVGASPIDRHLWLVAKFLGAWLGLLLLYAFFALALCAGQLVPGDDATALSFRVWPYVKFGFLYVGVSTFFVGALSFAASTLSGSMKPAYVLVTVLFVGWFVTINLLGEARLGAVTYVEPSGTVWLIEQVAKSRGNAWLNEHAIRPDAGFWLNRAALVLTGLVALGWTAVRFGREEFGAATRVADGSQTRRALAWLRGGQPALEDHYTNWSGRADIPRLAPAKHGLPLFLAQLRASLHCELRLLGAERSLWIMVPIITVLCGVWEYTLAGPFRVPIYPVSSEFAREMVGDLLIFLAGTTIFYCGESVHRDGTHGLRPILYATSVSNTALILAKYLANVLLALGIVLVTCAIAMISQLVRWRLIDGRAYWDPGPYLEIGGRVLLPAILVLVAVALVVNVLVRSRYAAYFCLVALSALYVWRIFQGERAITENPFLVSHWAYSDITRLEPFAERLRLAHLYWGAWIAAGLGLATWLMPRRTGTWRQYLRGTYLVRHPWGPALFAGGAMLAALVGSRILAAGELLGTEREVEEHQLAIEREHLGALEGPRVAWERVDLDVALWPAQGRLDVRGTLEVGNPGPEPIATAWFTTNPLFEVRTLAIEGGGPLQRHPLGLVSIELDPPLEPGATTRLSLDWSGRVPPGIERNGGPQSSFVHRSGTFVSTFDGSLLPIPGVDFSLFLADRERRKELGLGELTLLSDRSGDSWIPNLFGTDRPYDLDVRVEVPAGMTAIAGGVLVGRHDVGDRQVFHYRSEQPVRSFVVLAAHYSSVRQGDDEVWFHPEHDYNLDTILTALGDARRVFGQSFGPYPHRGLRIVEYPRLASFAQSFPTTMPYSEAIGFLTNYRQHEAFVDATWFVTAHEVAHQWWGYILPPGKSRGAQVLSESLAEYSALMLLDEMRGERSRLVYLKQCENTYLRRRDPDQEKALADLEIEGAYVWYQKGAFVFQMLERQIGRPALLDALRRFADRWRWDARPRPTSHPTIEDLLAEIENARPEEDLTWFLEAWFRTVTVPDMALVRADVRPEGGRWRVGIVATNLGEGRLPVSVEAMAGTWDLDADEGDWNADFRASTARRLWLEPGRDKRVEILCDFEPQAVILDRLYECLDFDRTNNRLELEPASGPPEAPDAERGLESARAAGEPRGGG